MECRAEKNVHYLESQGHSEGLYNQNMTISAIPSELLVSLPPNLLIVQHDKWQCPVKKIGVLCSRLRSQQRFKMSVNVCLYGAF